ncbi:hypothetical protein SK128_012463 [Halocaridina rubra]|uniref:Uncharacterized protein n=1 Tax=Halocaridina rubra TaxID=373956 RepID=A0AAN8ZVG7_HALRR
MYGKKNFHIGKDSFSLEQAGIACPTGHPIRYKIDKIISHLTDGGIINKWIEDDFLMYPERTSEKGRESKTTAMALVHIQAAFYLLLGGLILAALCLLGEVMLMRIQTSPEKNING